MQAEIKNLISGEQEDQIYKIREFIRELSAVQDLYYERLKAKLGFDPKLEEFLFDHVYNSDEDTFEEYLSRFKNINL